MTNKGKSIDPLHEESLGHITEVGQQAVWSLSSCKPGKNHLIAPIKTIDFDLLTFFALIRNPKDLV